METREITTQAELDVLPRNVIAIVRKGYFDAYGSATVRASDSATVRAYDSATVRAYDSATVRASGSATVRAYDSATVRASGSATVSASKGVPVHRQPGHRGAVKGGVVIKVPNTSTCTSAEWLDWYGADLTRAGYAVLFKAVNDDWQTGRGAEWTYKPGLTVTARDFAPTRECGNGLHLCAAPHLSQRYLEDATKFVAVKVKAKDLIPLGDKAKAPSCIVLYEVDQHGRKL